MGIENENQNNSEAKRAAYALNLCTVSVSQILDYNDPMIMDQEYDAILNNLNLQNMPKEEIALLEILEKILDTITFFRINEKEKEFVEREYQEKMKSAIWDAVPNFGMILSGEPITMAISLATQVGIGYMNYRREKVRKNLEYDREMWQLEKTAIEQINGLRRQLFDAAWKLSKTYDYKEEFRLTERQIKQYNDILLDTDNVRRFERLESIKGYYEAYPTFWYYLANAANMIYQEYIENEEMYEFAIEYRKKACEYYEKYLQISMNEDKPLLREEPIRAACCLEYIDLLDVDDTVDIKKLIDIAIKSAGGRMDIIQLAVFSYLKIGETKLAQERLKELINEDYNAVTNAQLLSRIYVSDYIDYKNKGNEIECNKIEALYKILADRVDDAYLMPLPCENESIDAIQNTYEYTQRQLVVKNYIYAFRNYFEKASIAFNHLIPVYSDEYEIPEEFFGNDSAYTKARLKHAERRYKDDRHGFEMDLLDSEFWNKYLIMFDNVAKDINRLTCVRDIDSAVISVKKEFEQYKNNIKELHEKLSRSESSYDDYEKVAKIEFMSLFRKFIGQVCDQTVEYICSLPQVDVRGEEINLRKIEGELRAFCVRHDLESPEEKSGLSIEEKTKNLGLRYFDLDILGEFNEAEAKKRKFFDDMDAEISKYKGKLLKETKKSHVNIIYRKERTFNEYFKKVKRVGTLENNALMIIDDKSFLSDRDLVFALDGIYAVIEGSIVAKTYYTDERIGNKLGDEKLWINKISKPVISGKDVAIATGLAIATLPEYAILYAGAGAVRMLGGDYYSNKEINIKELYKLIEVLGKITEKYQEIETSSSDCIDIDMFFETLYEKCTKRVGTFDDDALWNCIFKYADSVMLVDQESNSNSQLLGTIKKGEFCDGDQVIIIGNLKTYTATLKTCWGITKYEMNCDNDNIRLCFLHFVDSLEACAVIKIQSSERLKDFISESGLYAPIELGD